MIHVEDVRHCYGQNLDLYTIEVPLDYFDGTSGSSIKAATSYALLEASTLIARVDGYIQSIGTPVIIEDKLILDIVITN